MSVKTVEEDFDRQKTSFFLNREIFMHACISWTFQAQEFSRSLVYLVRNHLLVSLLKSIFVNAKILKFLKI